jgi:hypothetical protein
MGSDGNREMELDCRVKKLESAFQNDIWIYKVI